MYAINAPKYQLGRKAALYYTMLYPYLTYGVLIWEDLIKHT